MTSQKCLSCNLVNFQDAQVCKRCNTSLFVPVAETRPAVTVMPPAQTCFDTKCPQCSSGDTQSFSMVVNTGTSSGSFNGLTYSQGGGIGSVGGRTVNQTALASRLQPPQRPSSAAFVVVCILLFILTFCGLFTFLSTALAKLDPRLIIFAMIFGFAAAIGVVVLLAKYQNPKMKKEREIYLQNLASWQRSWICLRCGFAFVPPPAF